MSTFTPRPNQLQLFCPAVDDLKYSIRSVCTNANFFRFIFLIIGDYDQIPPFLKQSHKRLKIVRHSEFIPQKFLPCFNTNVIESFIHKIPEISENFLYFNDDTYIAKPVTWKTFFTANNKPINRHAPGQPSHSLNAHPMLYVKMMQNAIKKFQITNTRYHIQVQPFKKSIISDYEKIYNRAVLASAKHKYRQANDFNLLRFSTCLSSADGKAKMRHTTFNYDYFTESVDKKGVEDIIKVKPTFFCINNNSLQNTHVKTFLKSFFAVKSSFEA
jgi:hypothetical protein